jgi:hypothetical protein
MMMTVQSSGIRIRVWSTAAVLLLNAASFAWCQSTVQTPPTPSSQAQTEAEAKPSQEEKRTAKQKMLDDQAQRLVTMATELKVEVDKTNKNILSLQVVRKAEEIEALAHKMKDQEKR